jgi:hypothetical protein
MKFLSFDTAGMEDKQVLILKEIYDALARSYKLQISSDYKNLNQLLPVQNAQIAGVLLLQEAGKKSFLIFTKVFPKMSTTNWTDPKVNYKSYQVYALSYLNNNVGEVFIRKKKIIDVILEMFISVAVKVKNDRAFNRKFYVVADVKAAADSFINQKFKRALMEIISINFFINIRGRVLVVESADKLNCEKALRMADFAHNVTGL